MHGQCLNKMLFSVSNPAHPDEPITFQQLLTHRSSIKDGPAYQASYACGDPTLPKYGLEKWPLKPGTFHAHCFYSFPNYPDGLVRTSTNQLAHFLMAYMNGGVYRDFRLLKKDTVSKMLTVQNETDDSQGVCWRSRRLDNGIKLWGHGGGDPGINTGMYFSPERRVGVIVFTNCSNGGITDVITHLFIESDQL